MNQEEVVNAYTVPFFNPAYPRPPFRFVNREFIIITYRTDPAALERVVPAPLKVASPVVKFEFIKMPDSSGFGGYTESGQIIPVTLDGVAGGYTHAMYLDSTPAILAGRETLGFPKVYASPKLEVRGNSMVGTLDYEGVRVATATMAYKHAPLDLDGIRHSLETPGFLLKSVPDVDGSRRICELVKYAVGDLTVKGAWSGPASLELHPHCLANVAQLPVLEVLSAVHILTDLTLDRGERVFDYLASPNDIRQRN